MQQTQSKSILYVIGGADFQVLNARREEHSFTLSSQATTQLMMSHDT